MNELIALDLSRAPLVNKYLAGFPPRISEHTFTNLFVWRESRPVWVREVHDTLVLLFSTEICRGDELMILGAPAGKLTLAEVFHELGSAVIGAERVTAAETSALAPDAFAITADLDNSDYVYRVRALAELHGRDYAKKRGHIKHCLANYECVFEPISEHNLNECRDFFQRWCQSRQCRLDPGLCSEAIALDTTLAHFRALQLRGGAVRVDGRIQAFSLGERLNQTTAVCHFEKALPEINGLSQLINQWFAKESLAEFEFVNREQDLGVPGLRQAKESYHPDHLVEKFKVFRTGR